MYPRRIRQFLLEALEALEDSPVVLVNDKQLVAVPLALF